ncbi:DMT family transporter [Dawidia soli]|uniref:DMT family transporter n=1 Tax=Dawidia soli TaxID=2782352 RepID=A0AAP2DAI2_9BACT|nr:DMT family transporter [Dawidia soli]MBT1687521.1 DMT family transporter [Dawidia soli]
MASRNDYYKLHFIVFLWGFSAILGKLVTIPAVEMIVWRALFAFLGMGFVIFTTRSSFVVGTRDLIRLLLIGVIVAVHWIAFFGAARVSNVSVSLIGFATNSLWAAILEPWFNRTRIKKFEIALGLVVIFGLYIIFSFDFQYKLGLLMGIAAGFTSALFSIFNARAVKHLHPFTITFYEMIGVFLAALLFLPVYQHFWATDHVLHLLPSGVMDVIYIALLAGVCSVYAYTVAVELMKRISVFVIQLSLNLEPVYGIVMATIIFGSAEKMGWNFYLGTCIIMLAVGAYPVLKKRVAAARERAGKAA